MNLLGWIGSIMLALCALPQAIQSYKYKESEGLSISFLVLWTLGDLLTLIAVLHESSSLLYLLFNYGLNLVFLSIIWYYKLRGRK